ncbi:hypothetical protein F4803DRAFT_498563 [Xylaria telfairii]|nr:hypothetical protein F4803DRAFT_498563 [Xylaria telfairii]
MTFNTNPFWGSSDSDTFYCHTPTTTLGLLNTPPDWDGFFDFKESIDPKSSLELLQGPLPCTYEPHDEWLIEFKRLQDVYNRAPAMSVRTTTTPLHHEQSVCAANNITPYQPEIRHSYPSQPQCHARDKFSKNDGPACVRDKIRHATPTPVNYSCSTNGRSPGLYNWSPTPAYDNQQAFGSHDVQRAIKRLREIEQNLQADTKRRMCQIEQSRPG